MKKQIFLMIAAAALFLTGCNSVDLSPLEKRIAELEGKVNAIEKSVSDLNSNASGIKTTVDALKQKLTVVSVEEVSDGYKITFSDGKEAVIKDGAAGAAGAAGPQGPEGPQGPAGTAPTIGVSEVEGVLVWTVNGEAVKDKDGKVVPVSSTPAAPEFKYEKGVWYYRIGEGEWVACSEGEASAIDVLELDDVVLLTIGDTVITLPKESVSAPIACRSRRPPWASSTDCATRTPRERSFSVTEGLCTTSPRDQQGNPCAAACSAACMARATACCTPMQKPAYRATETVMIPSRRPCFSLAGAVTHYRPIVLNSPFRLFFLLNFKKFF